METCVLQDQIERNQLVLYWKHLSAVVFGCVCLFVFEMCERWVDLRPAVVTDLALMVEVGVSRCCHRPRSDGGGGCDPLLSQTSL